MDRLVGRQRVPALRLAWLDSRTLEHRCSLDNVVWMLC